MPLGSDHFLLGRRQCVKESLHRRLAEAPASLMWPRLIVFANPQIKIGLELVDRTIHLFAEGDAVELVEHGLVEALADAVGLRALGLGPRMVDVLDGKICPVAWPAPATIIFCSVVMVSSNAPRRARTPLS